jgi:hypothetical protein
MRRLSRFHGITIVLVVVAIVVTVAGSVFAIDHEHPIGNPAFERVWQRQDRPVDERVTTDRSWTWGPSRSATMTEQFVDATDGSGQRTVQYFDKSRMEINDPGADPTAQWYVTNGLLPIEMMTGEKQIGFNTFVEEPSPANITAVGNVDLANPGAFFPTYADLEAIYQNPGAISSGSSKVGSTATEMIQQAADGSIETVPFTDFVDDPKTRLTLGENGHTVPQAFVDFQNTAGPVWNGSSYVSQQVYDPLFVFGKPVTEPYWVRVGVGDRADQPVLFQVFERRVMTYDPNEVNPVFKVAMGNVGQHFHIWQYGAGGMTTIDPTPTPAEEPVEMTPTPTEEVSDATPTPTEEPTVTTYPAP